LNFGQSIWVKHPGAIGYLATFMQQQQHHHLKLLLFHSWFISFPFLVGKKLQCQTQQRDGVKPATSELPGCPSAWTTGRMDRGRMTGRMTGRTDAGEASFLIPTSFTI